MPFDYNIELKDPEILVGISTPRKTAIQMGLEAGMRFNSRR